MAVGTAGRNVTENESRRVKKYGDNNRPIYKPIQCDVSTTKSFPSDVRRRYPNT